MSPVIPRIGRVGCATLVGGALLWIGAPSATAADGWTCPIKGDVSFLQGVNGDHDGVDMGAGPYPYARGKKVRAVTGGTVSYEFDPGGYGNYVNFHADGGRRLVFAHLANVQLVPDGAHVEKNDAIGRVGSSGNAPRSAPHLHFEVRQKDTDAVMDPVPKLGNCAWIDPP